MHSPCPRSVWLLNNQGLIFGRQSGGLEEGNEAKFQEQLLVTLCYLYMTYMFDVCSTIKTVIVPTLYLCYSGHVPSSGCKISVPFPASLNEYQLHCLFCTEKVHFLSKHPICNEATLLFAPLENTKILNLFCYFTQKYL